MPLQHYIKCALKKDMEGAVNPYCEQGLRTFPICQQNEKAGIVGNL